jgi:4-amino-4-deoxy-L-arabinose transferase-like glycosyltransferase
MTAIGHERSETSSTTTVLIIIVVAFVLRAVVATIMGFSFDETYHVVMSRQPALGYSDHPPVTMWLISAATWLAGNEAHLVVRLPTLLLFAGTSWFIYRLTEFLFDSRAGLYALILLNLSPQFGVFIGTFAITDGPIMFGLSAAAYFLARALFHPPERAALTDWILAGAFFGFAGMSKYTVVLTFAGLLVFFLTQPQARRWLFHPAPYVAALTALLVMSPMIIWNALNDWVSFAFQGERAAMDGTLHTARLLRLIVGLFLMLMPPIFIGLVIALVDGFRRGPSDAKRWYLSWLAVVPIVFFALVWFLGRDEARGFHWVAPGFLFAFPLLGAALADLTGRAALWRRTIPIYGSLAVVVVGVGIFLSHILTGWIAYFEPNYRKYDALVADITDWTSLRIALSEREMLDPDRYFVVVARWELCYKAIFALGDTLDVVCLGENPVGFAPATEQASLLGKNAIIVDNWWNSTVDRDAFTSLFTSVEPGNPVTISRSNLPVLTLRLVIASDLKTPFVARSHGAPRSALPAPGLLH